MPQDQITPDHAELDQTIERCAEAYHLVMAEMPKNLGYLGKQEHWQKASIAFCSQLPILLDPPSFQLYIACIARGTAIGAIDIVDAGRFCHIAQTAMSAWKLANLIVPAAQARQEAARQKEAREKEKQATPLPSKGNQSQNYGNADYGNQLQDALDNMPLRKVQHEFFELLRKRGVPIPSNSDLSRDAIATVKYCRLAESIVEAEAMAEIRRMRRYAPEPAPAQQEQPEKAA